MFNDVRIHPLSPGQTRMRVVESSDSRSRLASNSHALSATLMDSRPLTSNLNILKCFVRVARVFGRLAQALSWRKLSCNSHEIQLSQLSTSFDGLYLSLAGYVKAGFSFQKPGNIEFTAVRRSPKYTQNVVILHVMQRTANKYPNIYNWRTFF